MKTDEEGSPKKVRIEASSKCQLKCPACPTARGLNRDGVVGSGHLRFEDFALFMERHSHVRHIELSNWGEIFLNPDLAKIVEHAHALGVALSASGGVNFNHASEEALEAMVRCGFEHMDISIDGATNDTYSQYRVGGDLDHVLRNIRRLNRLKADYGSDKPQLTWKFIVFGHNEHELTQARAIAQELGMEFRPALNFAEIWDVAAYAPVRDAVRVVSDSGLPVATYAEYEGHVGMPYLQPCLQLWDAPQVNWNGELLGCCHNTTESFGNVFVRGLDACMSNERYRAMQALVAGKGETREDLPCHGCALRPD